jgi:hypothetical protein
MIKSIAYNLLGHHNPLTRSLARAVVYTGEGLEMLYDHLIEIGFENMESIKVGETYFIRTLTYHYFGRVKEKTFTDLVLEDASWVAVSDRLGDMLSKGQLNKNVAEIERYPDDVIVALDKITDATVWKHPLPDKSF